MSSETGKVKVLLDNSMFFKSGRTKEQKMSIWHCDPDLNAVNNARTGTMPDLLGIKITEIGDDYVKGTMPVDHRTIQPYGILHGGANVTLAETLGSIGSALCLDPDRQYCVGLDINANHIRSISKGTVTGIASPLHIGRRTHVWNIEIRAAHGKLISVSRLTMAILDKHN